MDGMDYRILVEADFLVNLYENNVKYKAILASDENIFQTETGRTILKTMFEENTGKEKGALEKLNEIGMELQEMEESMAFMDEYAQKFYKMAREDEKSFRREMRRQAQNGEQKK